MSEELHRPSVDSWHDAIRLASIVRNVIVGKVSETWQVRKINEMYVHSVIAFEEFYSGYWEKWTRAEKEEVIRRWTIYKLS